MRNIFDESVRVVSREKDKTKKIKGVKLMETSGKLCYCFSFGGFSYDRFEDLIFIDIFTGEEIYKPNIDETRCLAGIELPF